MLSHGGFDAVIGNPPFLAGKRISIAYGTNLEKWMKSDLGGMKGAADMCAHFIRRAWTLVRGRQGSVGLIATDRVGQGDTSAMSTQILSDQGSIYRAVSQFRWPGSAATSASILWATHLDKTQVQPVLDGAPVQAISPSLTNGGEADLSRAMALSAEFLAGTGVKLYGEGFVLQADDPMLARISVSERKMLQPFVNGESLLSGRDSGRFAIDVNQFATEEELFLSAPVLAEHLKATVKPVRDAISSQVHDERYGGIGTSERSCSMPSPPYRIFSFWQKQRGFRSSASE